MAKLADRVKEITSSTGTGPVSLEGAVLGFSSFSSAFVSSDVVSYCIEGSGQWEIGEGYITSGTPWTLTRSKIISGSNGASAVNFAAGIKNVFCTTTSAAYKPFSGTKHVYIATAGSDVSGLGTAELPYASIQRALDDVFSHPYAADGSCEIHCAPGVYSMSAPISLTKADARLLTISAVESALDISIAGVHSESPATPTIRAYSVGEVVVPNTTLADQTCSFWYECISAGTISSVTAFQSPVAGSTFVNGTSTWLTYAYEYPMTLTLGAGQAAQVSVGMHIGCDGYGTGTSSPDLLMGPYRVLSVDTVNNRVRVAKSHCVHRYPSADSTNGAKLIRTVFVAPAVALEMHHVSLKHLGDIGLQGSSSLLATHASIQSSGSAGTLIGSVNLKSTSLNMYYDFGGPVCQISRSSIASRSAVFSYHRSSSSSDVSDGAMFGTCYLIDTTGWADHFTADVISCVERSSYEVSSAFRGRSTVSISGGALLDISSADFTATATPLASVAADTFTYVGYVKTVA